MTKNRKRFLAILVIVAVLFSVVSFVIPTPKNGLFWLSWLFGLLATVIQLYTIHSAFGGGKSLKSKFYGFPVARVSVIYWCAQLLLSLVFIGLSAVAPVWVAIILYIFLLASAAIGFIGTDAARDEVERQEIQKKSDTSFMTSLQLQVSQLAALCKDSETKKVLEKLEEEIRFSDPVSSGREEKQLEVAVKDLALAIEKQLNVEDSIQSFEEALRLRNRQTKIEK